MRNRPPKRRCPRCGGEHYAWQEGAGCAGCRRQAREDDAGSESIRELRSLNQQRLRDERDAADRSLTVRDPESWRTVLEGGR